MAGSDPLAEYNRKRDFAHTDEPVGDFIAVSTGDLVFAVQKHAATRLHFDLRLEWRGVLLSWAITRGPSNAQTAKRLAVRTEDHPLNYAEFEGTIPKGSYGAGTVMLWDFGTWQPLADFDEGLAKGTLKFTVFGTRMRGAWTLVRMKPKAKEKRENWLLIKERDAYLDNDDEAGLVRDHLTSVSSGRTMGEITSGVEPKRPPELPAEMPLPFTLPTPAFAAPQLASTGDHPPEGEDWLHETKYDGYRCLAALGSDGIRLYTRNGLDWAERYSNFPRAFHLVPCQNALIDGEVIADGPEGTSAFSNLQRALESRLPVRFFAFDLLVLDGNSLTHKPLSRRKEQLRNLLANLPTDSPIHYAEHVIGNGPAVFEAITKAGGEGTIAKQADASYTHGRSTSWLKIKTERREEFVIGGFSPSAKRGRPFASLLVGTHDRGHLLYRGRVGSGFGEREFATLKPALHEAEANTCPFEDVPASIAKSAHWVSPELVAEVSFAEFTSDGHIRHGVFVGLREDKALRFVTATNETASDTVSVAGVAISSPDRIVYPTIGVTKLQVARYYETVGDRMLAHAAGRPISLVRAPDGLSGSSFFQRHASQGFPNQVRSIDILESDGDVEPYLYVTSTAGLVAAAQMGTIEFHIWGCRTDAIEKPDRLVFDLDPDESLTFEDVKRSRIQRARIPKRTRARQLCYAHRWERCSCRRSTAAHSVLEHRKDVLANGRHHP